MAGFKMVPSVLLVLVNILSGFMADGEVHFEATFVASNAIKASVCVNDKAHEIFDTGNFKLSSNDSNIEFKQTDAIPLSRDGQYCKSYMLWFTNTSHSFAANLTLEASVMSSNSTNLHRTGVVNLSRTAHHPPVVRRVELSNYAINFYEHLPGPLYSSSVPKPIAMYIPENLNPDELDTFRMVCIVEGHPSPRVRWFKDNIYVSDGHDYNASEPGFYRCEVYNEYGTSLSHTIHLKEAYMGDIPNDGDPFVNKVSAGSEIKLECKSQPSCFPKCIVQWYKSADSFMLEKKEVSIDNKRLFLTEEGSLVILETNNNDTGHYVCGVCEDDVLGTTKLGTITKVTVTKPSNPVRERMVPKQIYKSKNPHVAIVGDSYKMICLFHGRPKPDVLWYKGTQKLASSVHFLNFPKIKEGDADTYYCAGKNRFGETEKYPIVLKVESYPVINHGQGLLQVVATSGSNVTIHCNASGTPPAKVSFLLNQKDMSQYKIQGASLQIKNISTKDIGIISCNASNSVGFTFSSTFINVTAPTVITSKLTDIDIQPNSSKTEEIFCEASTDHNTILTVTWYKGGKILQSTRGINVTKGLLRLHTGIINKDSLYGHYECVVTNVISSARKGFYVFQFNKIVAGSVTDQSEDFIMGISQGAFYAILISIISGVVLVILAVCVATMLRIRNNKKYAAPRSRLSTLSDGTASSLPFNEVDPLVNQSMVIENRQPMYKYDNFENRQPIDRYVSFDSLPIKDPNLRTTIGEVYIDRQRINMNELIGKGQFGRVYLAVLRNEKGTDECEVAVKTLKYKADETEIVDYFLQEAIIMKNFTHPHVLSLTGISFELDGSPMVVLPYMSNGDLRNYIQDPDKDITVLELLKLGLQVARGMAYLSLRKYVHRDLACRNCMVDDTNTVKVADFGLSRDLFSRDYYREASGKRPLPVRWMAPECHKKNMFTTHSDVWSFGILLWELMTRGAVPYPNIENWDVSGHVASGNKLPQPKYCPTSVYKIMLSCWEVKSEQRTPFTQLVHDIEDIVHSANTMETDDAESFYINIHRTEESDYRMNNNNTTIV